MKLRRIRVENFKRFREPFDVDGLVDGLNLFAAPNESGKSTVAEAICAAFFERHRSGSVEHLRPWGEASATPTVELEFEIGNKRYRLTKAFLGRKRCDLVIEGQPALNGVAAEDHLANLLGFKFPGKGASAPEHMGIPGLLWVRQSTAHEISDAVSFASDHLRQVLGTSVGELGATVGDALLRDVERARNELLTPAEGKPRGEYDAALKRTKDLRNDAEQLTRDIDAYRANVDRLTALRHDHQSDERAQPWVALGHALQLAKDKLAAAEGLEAKQKEERTTLQQRTAHVVSLRSQMASFARDEDAVRLRAQAVDTAATVEATARAEFERWEGRQREAEALDAQARKQLERVKAAAEHIERVKTADDLAASLIALSQALDRARKEQAQLTRLQSEAAALAIPATELQRSKQLLETLRDANVRLDTVATSLSFDLLAGVAVRIGDESIVGRVRRTAVSRTDIDIEGVGRITVVPGGEHLGQLATQRDALASALDALLERLCVSSVAEAEERARQAEQRLRDAKASRTVLHALAPMGMEALEADLIARSARLSEVRAALSEMPVPPNDGESMPTRMVAEAAASHARAALEAATGALNQARVVAAAAQSDHAAARQELAAAQTTLRDLQRTQRLAEVQEALNDALAQEDAARERVVSTDIALQSANLDLLRQDVERLTRSARQVESDHQRRRDEIITLEAELAAKGALGLEEQRADCERECEAASRRADELGRRARALDYLLSMLREKRAALAQRLRAPLQKHLDRYLQILFPGARIEVAENLSPGAITRLGPRGQESSAFDQLSIGTREQMGIVARLAYADLLKDAGRPTLLILDDALVNSDEARLGHMKRVLYDAAQRHQVLIFTCHPAAWRDLGVVTRRIGR